MNGYPIELKPVSGNVVNYADITNNGFVVGVNPHAGAMSFWDNFLKKYKSALEPKK